MTYRYMKNDKNEKTLPLWAALGAPLVGVPLMVGLLALAAPKQEAPAEEPTSAVVVEPVDTYAVEPADSPSPAPTSQDGAHRLEALNVG